MSIVEDAANGQVMRGRLHAARKTVEGMLCGIDERISSVVTTAVEATKKRPVTVQETEALSGERILRNAQEGNLMKSGMNELGNMRAKLHNTMEENAGDVGRFIMHTTMAMNEWWTAPVENVIGQVTTPVASFVDDRIKSLHETIEDSKDGDGRISTKKLASETLNSVRQMMSDTWLNRREDLQRSKEIYNVMLADMVAYANHYLNEIREAVHRDNVNTNLKRAFKTADKRLKKLSSTLNPAAQEIRQQIEEKIYKAVDYSKSKKETAREVGSASWKKAVKWYGQAKKLTDSTFSYLHMTKATMIPQDVMDFCKMLVREEDRSPEFKKNWKEVEEMLSLLVDVFNLEKESAHVAA